jgi:predicted dehydrogenase
MTGEIRWGIVGTASIARGAFLPALREAGGGRAALVASRDGARAAAYAAENGIDAGVAGYARVAQAPGIDAVYVALPNSLHADWAARALRAGKAVLCEKPLCVGAAQTADLLDVAAATPGALLWEAFVFPFGAQHRRQTALLADGAVGQPAEIISAFQFRLARRAGNTRLSAALGGGALADVGCYPIRLACELFGPEWIDPGTGAPDVTVTGVGALDGEVDGDAAGIIAGGGRRLVLTCGFWRAYDTFARVLGDQGQIHLTNPFHPGPADSLTLLRPGAEPVTERPTTDAHSFTAALRHIHAVLRGEAAPEHTAAGSALATARALEAVQAACGAAAGPFPAESDKDR